MSYSAGEAPYFVRKLHDDTVGLGDRVKFECKVTGNPEPQLTWMKNGQDIVEGRKIKIKQYDGTASLILDDVSERDIGTYTCQATNPVGKAITEANLNVKCK